MKSFTLQAWVIVFFILISYPITAQSIDEKDNEFSLSTQIRPRFEYRNGAYRPLQEGEAPAILVHNRFRLNMDYRYKTDFGVHISLQNVNIWGQAQQVQVKDPTGGMSIFEAYATLQLHSGWNMRIGRQMIALDDDRIFGTLDWHPAGRSHDAVNINWMASKSFTLQTFFAYNQNYDQAGWGVNNPAGQFFNPTGAQSYQHLEVAHAQYRLSDKVSATFLVSNLGLKNDTATETVKTNNMQTLGTNWEALIQGLKLNFSGYYQTGKNAAGVDKNAYLLALSGTYKISPATKLTLGADYLSGNELRNGTTSGDDKRFDPFSGTNHTFYGYMDYYYVGFANQSGLLDIYALMNAKTGEKGNLTVALHNFNSVAKIYVSNEKQKSGLGTEIDLVYTQKLMPFVGLQVGYSTYFTTDTLKTIKGTPNARNYQDWFWVTLNVNPKIFSSKF